MIYVIDLSNGRQEIIQRASEGSKLNVNWLLYRMSLTRFHYLFMQSIFKTCVFFHHLFSLLLCEGLRISFCEF